MKFAFTKASATATRISFIKGNINRHSEEKKMRVLSIGVGETSPLNARKLRLFVRKAMRLAREHEITRLAFDAKDIASLSAESLSDEEWGRLFAENVALAEYEFTTYKSKKKGAYGGIETVFVGNASSRFKAGVKTGSIIAEGINASRDLSNTPGGDMTPTALANAARKAAKGIAIRVTVLEKKDVKKLGMGLMLGVDKGSAEPLKFIVMEYWGAGKTSKQKPIVLVGKGITFDTGGINLKSGEGLLGMNQDMTGGATVIAAITIAARLGLKKNIVALVPAVENAVSGSAYRPGDVLISMNGKTVEVLNTDAEGRLVLADALTYAERYSPRLVVDVATLTGASIIAVGKRASVIMTKNEALEKTLRELGELSGDYVWPLPLWDEYATDLKSNVADIANVAGSAPSAKTGGGCIHGGIFLSHFTEKFPAWAHIDIAPRMESIPDDNLAPGATGAPVRLLVHLLEHS